jgi:aminoglycoside phosphotransferase (APT) family kinase protein
VVEKSKITAAVVASLVAEQFPQWADLDIEPVALDGWDNTTFRLGEALSVRLPSADAYVPQVDKEHRWLPVLAPQLPFPIPTPVAMGRPGSGFPRPWSIYRWIDGDPAIIGRVGDEIALAADLARFLVALYGIDAHDGPKAGQHSFFRGGPLSTYDAQSREALELLGGEIDRDAATAMWDAAVTSKWDHPPVWVHGDVAASNLLVADGRLVGVIDFGCSAVGDPACDLVMAWTFFAGNSTEAFRSGLSLDEATWTRGRGWALWKALITLSREKRGQANVDQEVRRWGWKGGPQEVIARILAEQV